jgi:hypothetical protein
LFAVISFSGHAVAGGGDALQPDLVTLALQDEDVIVTFEDGRRLLRLSTEVANNGSGPLEIFPSPESHNCDGDGDPANDRDASQRTFADTDASGNFTAGTDGILSETGVGCMRYHAAHDHWHVLDFARYELRREPKGTLVAKRRKVGFCVGDNRVAFARPDTPGTPAYPFGPPGSVGCDPQATQGLSIGWADLYLFYVPGQELDITDLRPGKYCLISRADPRDLLDETNEDNNLRRTRLQLNPNRLSVQRLPGRCRA